MSKVPKNVDVPSIYQAIGSAISNWTRVGIQLYQMFSISLSLTVMQVSKGFSIGSNTPFAVLDAVDGFRGKLLMIDAALSTALMGLDDEARAILNEWAKERKKVASLHGNRNCLAHWSVARKMMPNGKSRPALMPPIYSTTIHQGHTETDINGWEEAFKKAADRLAALVARLASHQGLQRKFLQQTADQVRCSLPAGPNSLEYLERELSS